MGSRTPRFSLQKDERCGILELPSQFLFLELNYSILFLGQGHQIQTDQGFRFWYLFAVIGKMKDYLIDSRKKRTRFGEGR